MISEPLLKVVKGARINACIFILFGVVWLFLLLRMLNRGDQGRIEILLAGINAGIYLLPSALLLVFANRLGTGQPWAGSAIFVMAILLFLNHLSGMVINAAAWSAKGADLSVCSIIGGGIGSLPVLYLMAVCLNARPEFRHLRRSRERARSAGSGFPVIFNGPPGSMAGVKPPPRATGIRRGS